MKKIEEFNITGLGEILWDILPQGKKLGGAPANFAYHSKALGSESYVVSAVGNDLLGKEILKKVSDLNIDAAFIQIDDRYPTGTVDIKVDHDGTPQYVIQQGTAWDNIHFGEKYKNLAAKTGAVCFGSLAQRSKTARDTINQFLKATKQDCIRIFDINLRQNFFSKEIVENSLKLANYFKLNDEELAVVAKMFSFSGNEEKIIKQLLEEFKLELIALTKGAKGSDLYSKKEHTYLEATVDKIEDTVGAGDAFTAALIVGLLRQLPLKKVHKNAASLAAFVCSQKGATPALTDDIRSQII
jgi:fructokinase